MSRRLLVSAVTAVTACAAAVMGAQWLPVLAAPVSVAAAKVAPVLDGAAAGGNVIVVLKNQHIHLTLRARGGAPRIAATRADQRGIVAAIRASGGTHVAQLVSVNAVAAKISAAEVAKLRHNPAVKEIVPNLTVKVQVGSPTRTAHPAKPAHPTKPARPTAKPAALSSGLCPSDPFRPAVEPEALSIMRYTGPSSSPDQADRIATGAGIVIAIPGVDQIAGSPNLIRWDGRHVVRDSPTPWATDGNAEAYGVATSIAGQGRVLYDYGRELPGSGLPRGGCTFVIKGDAPGAELIDSSVTDPPADHDGFIHQTESQIIQGIDHACIEEHADVLVEPYELTQQPGQFSLFYAAYDAAVAAGVTVVAAAGDSSAAGPLASPATDPNVIAAGASTSLGLLAKAYGYGAWANANTSPLSSGDIAPNNRMIDLVAPGYAAMAGCSPDGSGCPGDTRTQVFFGTGEAAAFVGGAAADVIEAYAATHGWSKPSPAMVKEILTGTALDIQSVSGVQGAGQVDIYAAVRAAQQMPDTTDPVGSDAPGLIPSPNQIDVIGVGGATATPSITLYNASPDSTTVTGQYRALGRPGQILNVTEPMSTPDPSQPAPAEGVQAAAPITFTVPAGLSRMQADLLFPDPTNNTILSFELISPNGELTQISYDGGAPATTPGQLGTGPDVQHAEVANPTPGTWTVKILWANGPGQLQSPVTPGTFAGNVTFEVTTRAAFVSTPVLAPTVIAGHSSITVPLSLTFRADVGDQETSVQFTASNGAVISVPINRRTLIPSTGGGFGTAVTSTDSNGVGEIAPFIIDVPPGEHDIDVSLTASDTSPDNTYSYYLIDPSGTVVAQDATPTTTLQGSGSPAGAADLIATNPAPGRWEIDVVLNKTIDGLEKVQFVNGNVAFNQVQVSPSGLPDSPATMVSASASTPVQVSVTNTANTGRSFTLAPSDGDLTGGAVSTAVYLAPGQTGTLTANLTPTTAAGTAVSGTLSVVSDTSMSNQTQVIAALPYAYTVSP